MNIFGFNVSRIKEKVVETGSIIKGWADLTYDWYKPNWWQLGQDKPSSQVALRSSAVYTCVSILAQEIARLNIVHYENPGLKGQIERYNSSIASLLRKPNKFQNRSDFFLSVMYSLLMDGNFYGLVTKDSRGRAVDITPLNPRGVQPYVVPGTSEIYYSISSIEIEPSATFNPTEFIPQRNMIHIRCFTPTHPLIGVSPLIACMTSVAHGLSIQSDSTRFFDNGSKPSGILRTPKPLNDKQAARLRDAWKSGTTGINAGKVPVLDNDLQFQQMSLSAADAQVIEQYGMTKKDIANVYHIPLYMIGEGENQFKTAEAAQRDFITRSLGFYIEHIEAALETFFKMDGRTECIEFDVEGGIMRPEYIERIKGLKEAVQGGMFSPNEARASEGKPAKEGGDDLFMQRQMVPINLLGLDVLSMSDSASETNEETEAESDTEKSLDLGKAIVELEAHFA